MRKSFFIRLEEKGIHHPDYYNRELYDPECIGTPYKHWLIRAEEVEYPRETQRLFNEFKPAVIEMIPKTYTFRGDEIVEDGADEETELETYFLGTVYGNTSELITEEENNAWQKRYEHRYHLLPSSIDIGSFSKGMTIELSRRLTRNKNVVDWLLKEVFPEFTFEWQREYVPPTSEEIQKREIERRLAKIEKSLTLLDYEILELRKKGTSLWSICRKKGLTLNIVVHRLRKMSMLPKLLEDWPIEFQPLSREERRNLKY